MGDSRIEVVLDSPAYYPGQVVQGKVNCFFLSEEKIRGINVKCKGKAHTEWKKRSGKSTQKYTGDETYLDLEKNLLEGNSEHTIPAGTYTYPFSFVLPTELPSSFSGKHGSITYKVKANVDRPWKFDFDDKKEFNVYVHIDLNNMPEATNHINVSNEKQLCCFCFASLPIQINLYIMRKGYVPGETITLSARLVNNSETNVKEVKVSLEQIFTFMSTGFFKNNIKDNNEMYQKSMENGIVPGKSEQTWKLYITIPPNTYVPDLQYSKIISVQTEMEVEVVLPLPYINLKTRIPLLMGTIPLTDAREQANYTPSAPGF